MQQQHAAVSFNCLFPSYTLTYCTGDSKMYPAEQNLRSIAQYNDGFEVTKILGVKFHLGA